jgi:hypothetical protein
MNESSISITASDGQKTIQLRRMNLVQLKRIDTLLEQVGEFGELRLIIEKGSIRFVEVVVSKSL